MKLTESKRLMIKMLLNEAFLVIGVLLWILFIVSVTK